MSTDSQLTPIEYQEAGITRASLANTRQQLALLEEFVKDVLHPNQDFGIIPGTEKPTLLKPGAANIISAFQCHSEPHVDEHELNQDMGFENYIVRVDVVHTLTGRVVSRGFGSCNSYERKYRYREEQRVCPHCRKPAIIKGREEYGGGWLCWNRKGGCGAKFNDGDPNIEGQSTGQIENPDPLDQSNTYLKMAIKRAEVDAALRLPGVARFFTQDLEDIMGEPVATASDPRQQASEKPSQPQRQPQRQPRQSQPAKATGNCPVHNKGWGNVTQHQGRIGHPLGDGQGWCWKDELEGQTAPEPEPEAHADEPEATPETLEELKADLWIQEWGWDEFEERVLQMSWEEWTAVGATPALAWERFKKYRAMQEQEAE